MTSILLVVLRAMLRGVMPYPDLPVRVRVRRRARDLAAGEPWPSDEASVTADDFAGLALLRLLLLQRETRRAVRFHQREAAALLARTSIETCILGLWCLHTPDSVARLRASEIKAAAPMLTFLSSIGLISEETIRQAVRAVGEPQRPLDIRSMAAQLDSATGATLAVHLYDQAYRPASHYFTHATSSSLLRHVDHDGSRTVRPANPWVRRAPIRLADACVGLLGAAVADRARQPTEMFRSYAESHARRVLPPLLVTVGRRMTRRLGPTAVLRLLKQARDVRIYLSRTGPHDSPVEGDARLRALFNALIARLELDLPPEAVEPVIDHFVTMVLDQWRAELDRPSPETPGTTGPTSP